MSNCWNSGGMSFSFFLIHHFLLEIWNWIKSKIFSHTLCNKSVILCIYQNYLYMHYSFFWMFVKMSFTHISHNIWLPLFFMHLPFQKVKKKKKKRKRSIDWGNRHFFCDIDRVHAHIFTGRSIYILQRSVRSHVFNMENLWQIIILVSCQLKCKHSSLTMVLLKTLFHSILFNLF